MANVYSLQPDEFKLWENLYNQSLTIDGNESIVQTDGTKQLVLLPMMTYTLISTMLQKLKYLPANCFNRIVIGDTPICGLRPLSRSSPSLMYKLTEILRTMVDGVRKQHIFSITMIFYQKNNLNTVYDSYSIVFDYTVKSPTNESTTSVQMIAHIIHQIEFMFSWNDALPNDVELTFVLSTLDQFENKQAKVPSPFTFVKANTRKIYMENETNHLLDRLITPNGKIWLKFLPSSRQLSGSSVHSDDLPTRTNLFPGDRQTTQSPTLSVIVTSPKLKRNNKKSTDTSNTAHHLPSLSSSVPLKTKKKSSFLSTVKSFITPSRTPAPVTSSTPNVTDLVLIRHTSTPKPGETASRITLGMKEGVPLLSAISEVVTPTVRPRVSITSPTPSTLTTTDISTAATPPIAVERRSTMRGQAAVARQKIAAMQIQDDPNDDDDDDDDDDEFKKLFSGRKRTKKSKPKAFVPAKRTDNPSDVSSTSSATSNAELIFTPPTARKRPTTDRTDDDDLVAEHGTPPKTPRTARRNRPDEQTPVQSTPMDTSDLQVNIDSPRLLRSVTKKLQQQASAKKQLAYADETGTLKQAKSKDQEEMDRVYLQLERSSIALHYSMEESD